MTPESQEQKEPETDAVDAAFENMREVARRRGGRVPDLAAQGRSVRPRRSVAKPLAARDASTSGEEAAGPVIPGFTQFADLAAGWVTNHWAELVGEKIAQHTTIEMIKDKKVFITCDSTAWATNLKYMQRTILQQIAAKVGPDVIDALRIYGPQTKSWRKGPLHVKGRGPRDTYG